MSLVRFGEDSDLYLIGVYTGENKVRAIQCCGCKITDKRKQYTKEEKKRLFGDPVPDWLSVDLWYRCTPFPEFTDYGDLINHVREHVSSGGKVPEILWKQIAEDDWLGHCE